MILSIKEASKLLQRLEQLTPDENVELKFLESTPVHTRPKGPNNILFAELVPGDPVPPLMSDERFRSH